jgi:microcystin-dependent protein
MYLDLQSLCECWPPLKNQIIPFHTTTEHFNLPQVTNTLPIIHRNKNCAFLACKDGCDGVKVSNSELPILNHQSDNRNKPVHRSQANIFAITHSIPNETKLVPFHTISQNYH